MKGEIVNIFLGKFSCSVKVLCSDKSSVDIEIPSEVLTGKSMDERYAICKERGERYIACLPEPVSEEPQSSVS